MIIYKDVTLKYLKFAALLLSIIVITHIVITLILNNYLYYNTILMITLCLISIIIILGFLVVIASSIKRTRRIQSLLYDNCNPIKAIEELNLVIDYTFTRKHNILLKQFLSTCYFSIDDHRSANELFNLNNVSSMKLPVKIKMIWYNNLIMLLIKLFEEDAEQKVNNYFKELLTNYPEKQNLFDEYFKTHKMYKNFCLKQYNDVKKYYEDQLYFAITNYEKVVFSYNVAVIYNYLGIDYSEQKQFIIENGNTMIQVKKISNM